MDRRWTGRYVYSENIAQTWSPHKLICIHLFLHICCHQSQHNCKICFKLKKVPFLQCNTFYAVQSTNSFNPRSKGRQFHNNLKLKKKLETYQKRQEHSRSKQVTAEAFQNLHDGQTTTIVSGLLPKPMKPVTNL